MLYIDFEGNTVDEAINTATKELDLNKEDLQIEVISKGKKGFFGVGKKEMAQIRVYYKEQNKIGDILNEIKTVIGYLDREATVKIDKIDEPPNGEESKSESQRYKISIHSSNINHLIGKRGQNLKSLQTIVNALLQKHENHHKIIVDSGNYNQKKEKDLLKWIHTKAEQVLKTQKPVVLKSFNSYKRRLIHIELKKYDNLLSESKGEGKIKNIKISCLSDKKENSNNSEDVSTN